MSQTLTVTGITNNNDGKTVTLSYTLSGGGSGSKQYPIGMSSSDMANDVQITINNINTQSDQVTTLTSALVTGSPVSPN